MTDLRALGHDPPLATAVSRVALISLHTCPLDQPGTGDAGGMNVYVRQVSRRLAEMGIAVDVFTRWAGQRTRVREMDPGVRVIHLEAGPDRPVPKDELPLHLEQFLYSLLSFAEEESARLGVAPYDAVHSHYWLSGWVGRLACERWGIPLLHSFHTLGRVKNSTLTDGEPPEPAARIAAEERIVATADCVLAPTRDERDDLVHLYGASPERIRVVTPGVDTACFRPGNAAARRAARAELGVEDRSVVLFVGRLQVLKAPDLAVRTLSHVIARAPETDPVLLIVGGPSGNASLEPDALEKLAAELGVADRVIVRPPVPHRRLPNLYRAADVTLVPSRSESFGLVALESAACGTPVVAADVGGLRTTVRHGITGELVNGRDPASFGRAVAGLLRTRERRAAMGEAGARFARGFDWRRAASELADAYTAEASRLGDDLALG